MGGPRSWQNRSRRSGGRSEGGREGKVDVTATKNPTLFAFSTMWEAERDAGRDEFGLLKTSCILCVSISEKEARKKTKLK